MSDESALFNRAGSPIEKDEGLVEFSSSQREWFSNLEESLGDIRGETVIVYDETAKSFPLHAKPHNQKDAEPWLKKIPLGKRVYITDKFDGHRVSVSAVRINGDSYVSIRRVTGGEILKLKTNAFNNLPYFMEMVFVGELIAVFRGVELGHNALASVLPFFQNRKEINPLAPSAELPHLILKLFGIHSIFDRHFNHFNLNPIDVLRVSIKPGHGVEVAKERSGKKVRDGFQIEGIPGKLSAAQLLEHLRAEDRATGREGCVLRRDYTARTACENDWSKQPRTDTLCKAKAGYIMNVACLRVAMNLRSGTRIFLVLFSRRGSSLMYLDEPDTKRMHNSVRKMLDGLNITLSVRNQSEITSRLVSPLSWEQVALLRMEYTGMSEYYALSSPKYCDEGVKGCSIDQVSSIREVAKAHPHWRLTMGAWKHAKEAMAQHGHGFQKRIPSVFSDDSDSEDDDQAGLTGGAALTTGRERSQTMPLGTQDLGGAASTTPPASDDEPAQAASLAPVARESSQPSAAHQPPAPSLAALSLAGDDTWREEPGGLVPCKAEPYPKYDQKVSIPYMKQMLGSLVTALACLHASFTCKPLDLKPHDKENDVRFHLSRLSFQVFPIDFRMIPGYMDLLRRFVGWDALFEVRDGEYCWRAGYPYLTDERLQRLFCHFPMPKDHLTPADELLDSPQFPEMRDAMIALAEAHNARVDEERRKEELRHAEELRRVREGL